LFEHRSATAALSSLLNASAGTNHPAELIDKTLDFINAEILHVTSSDLDVATSMVAALNHLVVGQRWKNGNDGFNATFVPDSTLLFEKIYARTQQIASKLVAKLPLGEAPSTITTSTIQVGVAVVDPQVQFTINVPPSLGKSHGFSATGLASRISLPKLRFVMMGHISTLRATSVMSHAIMSDVITIFSLDAENVLSHVSLFFPIEEAISAVSIACRYWYTSAAQAGLWSGEGCSVTAQSGGLLCTCVEPQGREFALLHREDYFRCGTRICKNGATCMRDGSCKCKPEFRGTQCEKECPQDLGTNLADGNLFATVAICSGQGDSTRDRPDGCTAAGGCRCQGGTTARCNSHPCYRGKACQYLCPLGGAHRNITCSDNHDECDDYGKCVCKKAFKTTSGVAVVYPPAVIRTPQFVNENCNISCPVDSLGRYCSGHGMCPLDGPTCRCNFGYGGTECQEYQFAEPSKCFVCVNGTFCCNGGSCNKKKIQATGFGCDCRAGYRGIGCEIACPRTVHGVCNKAGTCDKYGRCHCWDDARGEACELLCPKWDTSRSLVVSTWALQWGDLLASTVCNGDGDSTVHHTGNGCTASGKCLCKEGFKKQACQVECPRGLLNGRNITCSGHGQCNEEGNCVCDYGWNKGVTGSCSEQCPGHKESGVECFGNGICGEDNKCTCDRGFMGSDCSVACERCPISGKLCCFGSCHYSGRCICRTVDGVRYVGTTCELKWHEQRISDKSNHTMAFEEKFIEIDGTGVGHGICMPKMRLNGPYQSQVGYMWHKTPQTVLGGFTTKFQIQIVDRSLRCREIRNNQGNTNFYKHCHEHGADGMSFVIRGSGSQKTGKGARELGYGGIKNSLAIEFDTWWNEEYEAKLGGAGHISINTRGHLMNNASHEFSMAALPFASVRNSYVKTVVVKYTPQSFSLESVHEDVIDNDRLLASTPGHLLSTRNLWPYLSSDNIGILEIFVDNLEAPLISIPIDLSKVLHSPDGRAFVGFTSSTAEYFQVHDVLQWYFCEGPSCDEKEWLTSNTNSSCESVACPRGHPWQHYPQYTKVAGFS